MISSSLVRRRALAVVAGLLPLACDGGDSTPHKDGELSRGAFRYLCAGDSDPFCTADMRPEGFPETFAVGGRFDLEYDPDDWPFDDVPLPRVGPASPVSVQTVGMGYAFGRSGFAAFLATDAFGEVYDLRHLFAAPVARIMVTNADTQELGTIHLTVGESLDVFAVPQDELRNRLGGSLDYAWTLDDETVARVASVDMDRDVTLAAVAPGTAMLTIEAGGFAQAVTVVVEGDMLDDGDGGTTDGDGDDDDDGDGDTTDDGGGTTGGDDKPMDDDGGTTGGDDTSTDDDGSGTTEGGD